MPSRGCTSTSFLFLSLSLFFFVFFYAHKSRTVGKHEGMLSLPASRETVTQSLCHPGTMV